MKFILIKNILSVIFLSCLVGMVVGQRMNPMAGFVFDDTTVPIVEILIPEESLALMLHPDSILSFNHRQATFIFSKGNQKDTLEDVGFRLRGNTSRYSKKKSFKISFNTFKEGRKWHGLEKLNLNGEHNDPSLSRAKFCFEMLSDANIPASRSNHVRLFVNGDFYGLYANIEHIDEEFVESRFGNNNGNLFKCFWPADLEYKGENPQFYQGGTFGNRTYDLKTNQEEDDYTDLIHFLDVLNNTSSSEFECELEKVFNVDSYLKILALEILTGHWDGPVYNTNNFYLYHNTQTDRFEFIPYDLDNTLSVNWSTIDFAERDIFNWINPNSEHPLYRKILGNFLYRERFSLIVEDLIQHVFNPEKLLPRTNSMINNLLPFIGEDPFYSLDYGFTVSDFVASFNGEASYFHVPRSIVDFVSVRGTTALEQIENHDMAPFISDVRYSLSQDQKTFYSSCHVQVEDGMPMAQLCYRNNEISEFVCIEMYDDGNHNDGPANDGYFGAFLDLDDEAKMMQFYINSTSDDQTAFADPVCGFYEISFGSSDVQLVVNELMARNTSILSDEAGEFEDWIEIYNVSESPISLEGKFLSDRSDEPGKWAFPDTVIQPNEYVIIWADNDIEQGAMHASFKLSGAGEFVGIYDSKQDYYALIDGISFMEQTEGVSFGRIPNGVGEFTFNMPTPSLSNESIISSVSSLDSEEDFTIYPNPFSQEIEFSSKEIQDVDVKIVDVNGRVWHISSENLNHFRIDKLNNWPDGFYNCMISKEGLVLQSTKLLRIGNQ